MGNESNFEIIEHTADIGIRAFGNSLEEAFIAAAKGMFKLITGGKKIDNKEEIEIEIEDDDEKYLFRKWLDELLYYFDVEKMVFGEFEIKISKKNDTYVLKGKARGEKFDPSKHGAGLEIKAVTYHMLDVGKKNDKYFVQAIFDV